MNTVKIYSQDFNQRGDRPGYQFFTSDWSLPRNHCYTYLTDSEGIDACEEAFTIFNAPEDYLQEWQRYIQRGYNGPSLSVGDIVEVNGVEYMCCSFGWEKRTKELVHL